MCRSWRGSSFGHHCSGYRCHSRSWRPTANGREELTTQHGCHQLAVLQQCSQSRQAERRRCCCTSLFQVINKSAATIRATHALPVISANPDLNVLRRAHFAVELERNYFFQCRKDNDASACCSQAAACCKRHHVIGRKRPSSTKVNGRNWLCCLRGC
eukprot:10065-Heterococcus_DN1.PRE.2